MYSKIGRENLMLRHSVFSFSFSFKTLLASNKLAIYPPEQKDKNNLDKITPSDNRILNHRMYISIFFFNFLPKSM